MHAISFGGIKFKTDLLVLLFFKTDDIRVPGAEINLNLVETNRNIANITE